MNPHVKQEINFNNRNFILSWSASPHLKLQVLLPEFLLLQLTTFHLTVWHGCREVGQLRGNRPEPVLMRLDLLLLSPWTIKTTLLSPCCVLIFTVRFCDAEWGAGPGSAWCWTPGEEDDWTSSGSRSLLGTVAPKTWPPPRWCAWSMTASVLCSCRKHQRPYNPVPGTTLPIMPRAKKHASLVT